MRTLALIVMFVLSITYARPVLAEEPADSIQAVIAQQLDDFQRSDVDAAFRHAAPGIQAIFGDPQTFGRMVRESYPMVWRPARFEMQQLVETPAGLVQVVLFEDQAGQLHEAGYLMKQVDGIWRIAGVRLREAPGVGA